MLERMREQGIRWFEVTEVVERGLDACMTGASSAQWTTAIARRRQDAAEAASIAWGTRQRRPALLSPD